MHKKYILTSFVLLASVALIGASCTKQQSVLTDDTSGQATDNQIQKNVKTFDITGKNFSFSQKEIRVKKGDKVIINFTSEQGFHNWMVDEFSATTAQINPGQSSSIKFIADKAGTFEYYCGVGNHRQQGMIGTLIVEDDTAMVIDHKYSGNLADVTNGKITGRIDTKGGSSGTAKASFESGTYSLTATFKDLPDPQGSDFYEGWVVRKSPLSVISTGKARKVNGIYTNTYSAKKDLTDHNLYVLTIEPDDGNPEPAAHILEGTMLENN